MKSGQEFAKIVYGDSADIDYSRAGFNERRSKSVLKKQPKKIEAQHCMDVKVGCEHCNPYLLHRFPHQIGSFDILKEVSLSTPGLFYYILSRRNVCDALSNLLITCSCHSSLRLVLLTKLV